MRRSTSVEENKMSVRHANALAINAGAVNPTAIVHSLLEAYDEIRRGKDYQGTKSLTDDPAVRLMIYQLAYISGVDINSVPMVEYSKWVGACEEGAKT